MSRFIRPSTIYGDKFEEYLAITSRHESEASAFDEYA